MSTDDHKGWLALWAADVPNKIKVHAWRLAKNGLAVGHEVELQRRKIKLGVKCVVCHRDETLVHRFWKCPYTVRTWEVLRELSQQQLRPPPADVTDHGALTN